MQKIIRSFAAVVLAVIMAASCLLFAACSEKDPQDEQNPVILKLGDLKLRKFHFDSLYATNDSYYKMSQGAISMADYFDMICEQTARYAVTLKAARAKGYELTAEDEQNVINSRDAQWEHIKQVFEDKIKDDIEGEQARQEEFERLFVLETGYSSELYVKCLEESLRDRELIQKYFEEQTDGLEPTSQQVKDYLDQLVNNHSQISFSSFASQCLAFAKGEGDPVMFVPSDCFTVVQFMTDSDADMSRIESLIPTVTAEEMLNDVISDTVNLDENMHAELFRGYGYPIHESITGNYSEEFVFAAYRASGKKNVPGKLPVDMPEFEEFETSDGRKVVKVVDEEGAHYVMMLRKLRKGNLSYSEGDEIWQYGYDCAKAKLRQDSFDAEIEKEYQESVKRHRFTWYYDRFKSNYIPSYNID